MRKSMSRFIKTMGSAKAGITTLTLLFSTMITGFFYIEERFAKADDLKKIEIRLEINELQTLYKTALENLYFYRDQNRKYPDDVKLKEKLTEAEEEVKDLKDLLKMAKTAKVK